MISKLKRGFASWGHYLLALLCAAVVLLSAAWTRDQNRSAGQDTQALSDQSQRLTEVAQPPKPASLRRPASGQVTCGFSEAPVYFPETAIWKTHPALNFLAQPGDRVRAMADGEVAGTTASSVRLRHRDGLESAYEGLQELRVSLGQTVRSGDLLGSAGGGIPYEGQGIIRVTVYREGKPISFEEMLAEDEPDGLWGAAWQ